MASTQQEIISILDDDDNSLSPVESRNNNNNTSQNNCIRIPRIRKRKPNLLPPPSPSQIIVLDDDDDDDDDGKTGTDECGIDNKTASKKKRENDIDDLFSDMSSSDSDIEVVEPPTNDHPVMERFESNNGNTLPKSSQSKNNKKNKSNKKTTADTSKNNDDDDEIVTIGRTNVQRLPHLRAHCVEFPFYPDLKTRRCRAKWELNRKHCPHCYCFVCDAPVVPNCTDWDDHCLASDKGKLAKQWKSLRDTKKRKLSSTSY